MTYYQFYRMHPRILSFGVLLTLFSSFGQTFLISVFVPHLLEAFSLDTARFGALYAAATLTSAASLPFWGKRIDRVPLHRFSMGVGAGLVAASLMMALAPNVATLFVALVGLRMAGQGLLSLTASTTIARLFDRERGRALSITTMGYPIGEAALPIGVALLVSVVGWRWGWGVLAGAAALVLLPVMHHLLRGADTGLPTLLRSEGTPGGERPPGLLRDWRFWALMPVNLYIPFVLTALFLYHAPMAEARGWPAQTLAAAFVGFAGARLIASLGSGPYIDRFSALRLFPFILLPLAAGLLVLAMARTPWLAFVYLVLAGVSQGISGPIMTSLWAEIFGVESLGATKGTVATLGVFATALGPLVFGAVIARGISYPALIGACAALALAGSVFAWVVRGRLLNQGAPREPEPHPVRAET